MDTKNKTVYFTNILHTPLTRLFAPNLQRRSSKDVRGDSVSEWEKRLEKPSVPLMAKGPPGPPKIVEIEEKYSAIEGEHYYHTGVSPIKIQLHKEVLVVFLCPCIPLIDRITKLYILSGCIVSSFYNITVLRFKSFIRVSS